MKKSYLFSLLFSFFLPIISWANTLNLFNDSPYTLTATIYSASGQMLTEIVLNPNGASQWSNNPLEFGGGNNTGLQSQTPYTVNWNCQNGNAYGVCSGIAPGDYVTAQGCEGLQQCSE